MYSAQIFFGRWSCFWAFKFADQAGYVHQALKPTFRLRVFRQATPLKWLNQSANRCYRGIVPPGMPEASFVPKEGRLRHFLHPVSQFLGVIF